MSGKRSLKEDVQGAEKKAKIEDTELENAPIEDGIGNKATSSMMPADVTEKNNGEASDTGKERKCNKPSDECGTLLLCGGTNWDLIGRRELPKNAKKGASGRNLWSPHLLTPLQGIRVALIASGCTSAHSVIVTEAGDCMCLGRNEKGQLGVGDMNRRDVPTIVEELRDYQIIGAACGRNHTLFLADDGTVFASGDNKMGQCGVGNQQPAMLIPTKINFSGRPIVKVACGADFSVVLDDRGHLFSFGCPEYGQLGHNTDGRYFAQRNKLAFDCETSPKRILIFVERSREGHVAPVECVEIVDLACGTNHTVAVDTQKRAYSWGFGGYGRLGHAEQRDEMVPRLIKYFEGPGRRVKSVHAGSTYSMAVSDLGAVFLWGQTKRTGEANMYPKPIQDLSGWNIRAIGCSNTSIAVIADESVIAWGPSPTYGELGHGELKKSCTQPNEVKALEGSHVLQVACGMGHSMFVMPDQTEAEQARLKRYPEYTP